MTVAAMNVRPANYTDWAQIYEIMREFTLQHYKLQPEQYRPRLIGFTQSLFQIWLDSPHELHLVAETASGVIGFASAYRGYGSRSDFLVPRRSCYLGTLAVDAAHRRQGAGRALINEVEKWADEFGAEYVSLNVEELNENARAFYERIGYLATSEYRVKTLRHVRRYSAPET